MSLEWSQFSFPPFLITSFCDLTRSIARELICFALSSKPSRPRSLDSKCDDPQSTSAFHFLILYRVYNGLLAALRTFSLPFQVHLKQNRHWVFGYVAV